MNFQLSFETLLFPFSQFCLLGVMYLQLCPQVDAHTGLLCRHRGLDMSSVHNCLLLSLGRLFFSEVHFI